MAIIGEHRGICFEAALKLLPKFEQREILIDVLMVLVREIFLKNFGKKLIKYFDNFYLFIFFIKMVSKIS